MRKTPLTLGCSFLWYVGIKIPPTGLKGETLLESIRTGGLVEVGVALLEEVCQWGWALRLQKLKPGPGAHSLFLLPADPEVELLAPPAPCLPS